MSYSKVPNHQRYLVLDPSMMDGNRCQAIAALLSNGRQVPIHSGMNFNTHRQQSPVNRECKFGGYCKNSNCTFDHPKKCHFGINCRKENCNYWHPDCKNGVSCNDDFCQYRHPSQMQKMNPVSQCVPCPIGIRCPIDSNCQLWHPGDCKQGIHCPNPDCRYRHPTKDNQVVQQPNIQYKKKKISSYNERVKNDADYKKDDGIENNNGLKTTDQ